MLNYAWVIINKKFKNWKNKEAIKNIREIKENLLQINDDFFILKMLKVDILLINWCIYLFQEE